VAIGGLGGFVSGEFQLNQSDLIYIHIYMLQDLVKMLEEVDILDIIQIVNIILDM
tara:strand:+ start:422 stop:586 length:165 start_codon:yes stop_codon:yes gene_type:complete